MSDPGDLRASDAERDHALERLRDAVGEGRLILEELADRAGGALEARTRADLERVTADLPSDALPAAPSRGTRWVLGIMSSR